MRRDLVPVEVGSARFSWSKTLWLYAMAVPAVAVGATHLDGKGVAISGAVAFVTVCGGHSVGLHRGVIHRAFAMPTGLRNALLLLFCQTGLGGPLSWIRVHHARDTWQNRPSTPPYFGYGHGLLRDYVWNLHFAFSPVREGDWQREYGVPREIEEDSFLCFLESTWRAQVALAGIVAWAVGGLVFATTVVSGRVAATILFHWLIGYASHVHGRIRYPIPGASEVGRDSWVLGAISFGEGFHNTHHAFPRSARMGTRRLDVDVGWLLVRALEAVGLVRDVVRPDDVRAPRPATRSSTAASAERLETPRLPTGGRVHRGRRRHPLAHLGLSRPVRRRTT